MGVVIRISVTLRTLAMHNCVIAHAEVYEARRRTDHLNTFRLTDFEAEINLDLYNGREQVFLASEAETLCLQKIISKLLLHI